MATLRGAIVALFAFSGCALAQTLPLITEFQAHNRATLADEDGDFPGWIELHNPGDDAVDLDGWFLTDEPGRRSQWRLPAVNLAARGFLIVFASGKNRAVPGAPLHANFQLADGGECLALVRPDGVTVASEFAPSYPAQVADRSYGLGMRGVSDTLAPSPAVAPASLSPYVHLCADAGVTTNTVGNTVTVWRDRSTNGFVFRANHPRATANDPQLTAGPAPGTYAVNFDGTDLIDSDANLELFTRANSELTTIVVLKPASVPGSQRFVITHSPGAGGESIELGQDAGQAAPPGAWGVHRGSGRATSTGPRVLEANRYCVVTTEVLAGGDAGANVRFHTNGGLVPNQAGNWLAAGNYTAGADPLAIGARVDNKHNGFDNLTPDSAFVGDIAELVIYRRTLASEEREGVENFLLAKYGFPLPARTVLRPEVVPGQIGYFIQSTPGAINGPPANGFVADTQFSPDRGFYTDPIAVTIACDTPDAVIRYTTDCSAPTPASGAVYSGPIPIERTTVLRAAAFKTGLAPSDVDTQTYIFPDEVLKQPAAPAGFPSSWGSLVADYAMDAEVVTNAAYSGLLRPALRSVPTLALVTAKSNLWDKGSGIYANPQNRGDAWERPVSIEYIDPATGENWQADAGLRIHGAASRSGIKQSFNVRFRGLYGASTLRFPLFPASPVSRFDGLTLRGQWNDGWSHPARDNRTSVYVRDEWCRRTFAAQGGLATVGASMHVYIDGLYWGLYNPVEHIDAAFVALHLDGQKEDYDVLKFNGGPTVEDGDLTAWRSLMTLAEADLSQAGAYGNLLRMVEVDDLIDFMILFVYIGNEDGPAKNYYACRRRVPDGKWRFIPWDNEWCLGHSFSGLDKLDVNVAGVDAADTPTHLYARLRLNPEFRVRFGDRVQKHLFVGGALSVPANVDRYLALVSGITNAIVGESARWGDVYNGTNPGHPYTRDAEWAAENAFMLGTYFLQRPGVVLQQFRSAGLFPALGAPVFSQPGGPVPSGYRLSLAHTNASGAILFTLDGSDPRQPGGGVSPTALSYAEPIVLNAPALIRARVRSGANWSARVEAEFHPPQDFSGLRLTEIMYHPPDRGPVAGDEFEFLELRNAGPHTLVLGGLAFTRGVDFTFAEGTTLAPGQWLVLARNPSQFAAKYPGVTAHGAYSGRLDNAGETLTLAQPSGGTVLSMSYGDSAPWPILADGGGFSLVPAQAPGSADPNRADSWRASSLPGGSPGADDPASPAPPVFVNEVLTHSAPGEDFIELFNPNPWPVELGGWFLSDDATTPRKFRLPDHTVIPAGDFLVFREPDFNPGPPADDRFALNADGDGVLLFSADAGGSLTGYSHGFAFGAAAFGVSFGRHRLGGSEDEFPAQLRPTPGAGNGGPRVGPVVIDEIHYHPDAGDDEFVELLNIAAHPVALFDPARPTNTWRLDGLGFDFPANLVLRPGGRVLLVGVDPAAFRARHGLAADTAVLGPYAGALQDGGERLALQRPDETAVNRVARIDVDVVRYRDRAPWPVAADGAGPSLQRKLATAYGNDPANWEAAIPTPGTEFPGGLAPAIVLPPQSLAVVTGQTVTFRVDATGPGPLFFQWRRNGDALAGATNRSLELVAVQPTQAGGYDVVVFNESGSASSAVATLTVRTAALILAQPQGQTVGIGSGVTFSVVAVGVGRLRYQWRRDGLDLPGATNSVYTLSNAQPSDSGTYDVRLADDAGTVYSAPALLEVAAPPVVLVAPRDLTVLEGEPARFSVTVRGIPPISYRWRRNGVTATNLVLDSTNAVFVIPSAQIANDGFWSVVITNRSGAAPNVPGARLTVLADHDRDGMSDAWEAIYGFDTNRVADAAADADGDSFGNREESVAGTDPLDRFSYLQVARVRIESGQATVEFLAVSNRTYRVQYRALASEGPWQTLTNIESRRTNRTALATDPTVGPSRFYRLVTPAVPP